MREKFDLEYLRDVAVKVAAGIIGLVLLVYLGFQIWNRFTSTAEYEYAKPCTVAIKDTGTGYVFREETVIPANSTGSVVASVSDGDKVAKNEEVAGIYSSYDQATEMRLNEIAEQMSFYSSMGDECENLTSRDVTKLDEEIYSVITDIKTGLEEGDYSDAISHRTILLSKINQRSIASGNSSGFSARLTALENERTALKGNLGRLLETVTTPNAGWYYPEVDGYENIMVVDELKNLTYDRFNELKNTTPSGTDGKAGKVVTDSKWYFVCEKLNSEIDKMKVDEEYTLYFPYNKDVKIEMVLTHTAQGKGDMGVVVFSCETMPDGFDYLRMQNYEIVTDTYSGLKIPKSSVRFADGLKGVYVLTGEMAHFRKTDILCEYESSYIVAVDHDGSESSESESESGKTESEKAVTEKQTEAEPATETEKTTDTEAEKESKKKKDKDETADSDETSETEETDVRDKYQWLGINEKVITNGKGLKEGKVIRAAE